MNVEIINCFIASPSDTYVERNICDRVFEEINRVSGDLYGFRLEALKWENNTRPGFNDYSQKVITEQLGDNYQLFIGIIHQKFGTPTETAGSGTEEEFENAYRRLLSDKSLEIMFYFR